MSGSASFQSVKNSDADCYCGTPPSAPILRLHQRLHPQPSYGKVTSKKKDLTHCQISAAARLIPLQGECQEEHDR
jgi:hypothetical protein